MRQRRNSHVAEATGKAFGNTEEKINEILSPNVVDEEGKKSAFFESFKNSDCDPTWGTFDANT